MRPQSMHVLSNRRVQPNDPSMLCDRLMGAFRTHSSTRFVTVELRFSLRVRHACITGKSAWRVVPNYRGAFMYIRIYLNFEQMLPI